MPLAGAALYPLEGDRSLLDISLAGYVASLLALFALLMLRFRLAVAAGVTIAASFLPALVHHSSFPLTDSWGLALETSAFAAAILTLDRGRRGCRSGSRRSSCSRSRATARGFRSLRSAGALCVCGRETRSGYSGRDWRLPCRPLLVLRSAGAKAAGSPRERQRHSVRRVVVVHPAATTPGALVDLVRANGGFLRDGEWYTGLFLVGGVMLLLFLAMRGH